jgi:hypothetical protein
MAARGFLCMHKAPHNTGRRSSTPMPPYPPRTSGERNLKACFPQGLDRYASY